MNHQGFGTKADALKFAKKNGGRLCHAGASSKAAREYYRDAVAFGRLDPKNHPYCICWD